MEFTREEVYILWCALYATVEDVHAPVDTMTDTQWDIAGKLCERLTKQVELNKEQDAAHLLRDDGRKVH